MFFEIGHKTTYTYSRPVFLELHHLRLRPRSDGVQHVTCFDSTVEPRPSGLADGLDVDGNCVENVWFQGLTENLIVESRAKVITQYRNPFNYILAARADRLPVSYQDPVQAYLAPYKVRRNESHLVEQFARHIANRTEWKTLRFLTMLTREIAEGFQQTAREVGAPRSAEETYLSRAGSSRDLAVLFMTLAAMSASRLVSSTVTSTTAAQPIDSRCTLGAKFICRASAGAATIPVRGSP